MADLFRCDKCGQVMPKTGKAGRLVVQELGEGDGLPHPALYNRKLELCAGCFSHYQSLMELQKKQPPSFQEASDITRAVP